MQLRIDRKQVQETIKQNVKAKHGTVIHNDTDGILSGLYFNHKTNSSIQGMFELNSQPNMYSKLRLVKPKPREYIYLDCSIIDNRFFVIDHHSQPVEGYSDNNINCNKYTDYKDISYQNNFFYKNPTGNILWLMYLLEEDVSKYSYQQQLLLVMADGFYTNYQKYSQNSKRWLKAFDMECLQDTLNSPTIEEDIFKLKRQLGMYGVGYQILTKNGYTSYKANTMTQEVLNRISILMNWKQVKLPAFSYCYYFNNKKYMFGDIEEVKADKNNFTCAVRSMRNGVFSEIYVSEYCKAIKTA